MKSIFSRVIGLTFLLLNLTAVSAQQNKPEDKYNRQEVMIPIMVQIQSTWSPIFDRYPQKYMSNIFEAKESDYQVTTQKVFNLVSFPSCISLPVVQ